MAISKNNPFYDLLTNEEEVMTKNALERGKKANEKLVSPLLEKNEQTKSKDNPFMDLLKKPEENQLDPSILKRVPGAFSKVGSDVLSGIKSAPKAIFETIGGIPKDIEYLKKNIPAAKELALNDPSSAAKFAGAGLADIGHEILNSPSALANYLAKIGMIEKESANKIPRQRDISSELSQFTGEKPGGELIRGTFRNIPTISGVGKGLQAINPMRLTSSNIAKNVLKKEDLQKGLHKEMYDKIWSKAEKEGIHKVHYNPDAVDLPSIKKYSTEKYYGALDNFVKNPSLENAQKAQSDLGKLIRDLDKRASLTSEEKSTYVAAEKAQKNIKDSMFRDSSGKLNEKLKNQYDKVTESYGKNVIPYTKSKPIKEYKRKEITEKQLVDKLSRGPFAVKKGKAHPEIKRREIAKALLKPMGIIGGLGLIGAAGGATNALINKFLDRKSGEV